MQFARRRHLHTHMLSLRVDPCATAPAPRRFAVVVALTLAAAMLWVGATAYAQTPEQAPDVEMLWELMVFTRGPEGVQVVHLMHLANAGPRDATSVPLSVPKGARWVDAPSSLVLQEDLAVDPEPLAVGEERRYMLVYEVPWRQLPMAIRRVILYPTREMSLWVRAGELELRGVNLEEGGRDLFEGVEVETYRMTDVPPHPAWQVVLDSPLSASSRLLEQAPLGQRSDPFDILRTHPASRWVLGALLVVGLAALARRFAPARPAAATVDEAVSASGGTGGVKASADTAGAAGVHGAEDSAAPGPVKPGGGGTHAAHEIEVLKDEIVRIDVAFENGELDEDTYRLRRGELKERLVALMSAQKRTAGGERR